MTLSEPPRAAALRFLGIFTAQAAQTGARRWTYTEVALSLGWAPSRARNMMPFLNALRDLCAARGLPDLRAIIVASGTDLPSRKSFHSLTGAWADTTLTRLQVNALQSEILAYDWAGTEKNAAPHVQKDMRRH